MNLRDQRDIYNGFGDGLARAFEFAVTPVVVGALGYGLDRWLGLVPLMTILLTVVALVVKTYVMWLQYDAEMRVHEQKAAWARRS